MQAVVLVRGNYSVRKYRRTLSWCDKRIILEKYAEKTNQTCQGKMERRRC